uniref:cytochrome c oxidase assembly protein COX16 homolog, mitochondrial-like n=1 Tax=Ciona intestinalis TaxID=7719 RepID=UPI0002B8DC33|nr:cytochrome c oxidase assembly protein COX16 homolog, mitochondrial-like [Ciona intestinalis]|eukprot:XP_026691745.1 cytochrome c oxidase assembly protein COX16 homolog, mitochondrial-like [Ciona intestinalis]
MAAPMGKGFEAFSRFLKNEHVRYGSAFLSFMFLGWVGLREFAQVRYDVHRRGRNMEFEEEAKKFGLKRRQVKSVEDEYEEMKNKDLDNWFNIRGPRPDENSKEMQEEQRRKILESQNATV